jgi:hypothetical protein
MTARFRVVIMPPARTDSSAIQAWLVENYGPERADKWEEGFLLFIRRLTISPYHQVIEPATMPHPEVVRRVLYRPTKNSAAYYVSFTIEEAERPDPEPEEDYFAGIVRIIAIRHASASPMTTEEMDNRRIAP